jgi:hypothetical protein
MDKGEWEVGRRFQWGGGNGRVKKMDTPSKDRYITHHVKKT